VDIRVRTALISTGLNVLLTAFKFLLFTLTGSLAILAEAWHSCADVGTSLLVLLTVHRGPRAPEEDREPERGAPGDGDDSGEPTTESAPAWLRRWASRVNGEQWAALGIGVFLSVVALGLLYKVLLSQRAPIERPLLSGVLFLCFAVGSYFVFRFETAVGRSSGSVGLVSDGLHSKADMFGALLTGAAMILYSLGIDLDRPVAVLISLFVLSFGIETLVATATSVASRDGRTLGELHAAGAVLSLFDKERLERAALWLESAVSMPVLDWARAGRRGLLLLRWPAVALAAAAWLSSCLYSVGTSEQAILERFGRPVNMGDPIGPGVHLKLPWPVDRAVTLDVHEMRQVALGNVTDSGAFALIWTQQHGTGDPFLAGDNDFFFPYLVIHYRVRDVFAYVMRHVDADELLRNVADAEASTLFAGLAFEEIIGGQRGQLESRIRVEVQAVLDELDSGIELIGVYFKDVHPPIFIADAFERVIAARQEKQELINAAYGYHNRRLPEARGEALRTSEKALAYVVTRVRRAEGDAERFAARRVTDPHVRAVTQRRLHLEAVAEVVSATNIVLVDPGTGTPTLLLDGIKLRDAGMALPGVGETTGRNQGWTRAGGSKR
jgi:membrane protease subunit HflK